MVGPLTAPRLATHRLPTLLAAAVVLIVLAGLLGPAAIERMVGGATGEPGDEEILVLPEGHWNPAPPVREPTHADDPNGPEWQSPEQRARLVSLPYLAGRGPAPEGAASGVIRVDSAAVAPGFNLYNSGHGPEAILMDPEGRVAHRWRYRFERAFPGVPPTSDTAFFRRVRLLPEGRLLALYQTGGLVLLDRSSRLLGRCRGNFYNDFWLGEDGTVWTIAKELPYGPSGVPGSGRLDDFLVELELRPSGDSDPNGYAGAWSCREVRRISVTGAFRASDFADLLEPMAPSGDVLHTNTVERLERPVREAPPAFAPGNLLISVREIDVVAVLDPDARRVVWARRGPWDAQHEPTLLDNGHLLLFDNLGGDGGAGRGRSRVMEVDLLPEPGSDGDPAAIVWSWRGEPPGTLTSDLAGSCARLANGNTLVTESVPGRAWEVDTGGRVVWAFRSPHRAGPDRALVAMLFEVQRVPRFDRGDLARPAPDRGPDPTPNP